MTIKNNFTGNLGVGSFRKSIRIHTMKAILFSFVLMALLSTSIYSQDVIVTLPLNGSFIINDANANPFLTLDMATGYLTLNKSLSLSHTTSSTLGVIYKGSDRFIHDYKGPGTDGNNTFVGINAGNFSMGGSNSFDGSYNTAVGTLSFSSNTTGYYNSAFGVSALQNNTIGQANSAFGSFSLSTVTYGSSNSAFGTGSLQTNKEGYYNSAFGAGALQANTWGNGNSAFGSNSLMYNSTGQHNSAFGYKSLTANTWGESNSAFGDECLYYNTTGSNNSVFGMNALYINSIGADNSAFGVGSMGNNTQGNGNSAFGIGSLPSNQTGSYNSAFGKNALSSTTTGSNNIAIGYNTTVPDGTADNQVRIGNTSITYAGIQVAWTVTSDRRLKSNILNSNLGLGFISKLRPVSYTRNNDKNQKTEYGFIAQEVEELLKNNEAGNTGMISKDAEGTYSLRYNDLIAPLVKAIQELKEENDLLKAKNEVAQVVNQNLKTTTEKLKTTSDELKVRLTQFEKMQSILVAEIEKIKANNNETTKVSMGE